MSFLNHIKQVFAKIIKWLGKIKNKIMLYIEKFKEDPIRSLESIYLKFRNIDVSLQGVMKSHPDLDLTNLIMLATWANNCPELYGALIVGQGERKKNNHTLCRLFNNDPDEETTKEYAINDFRYGFEKFSNCGCEVAATYNAMHLLGKEDVTLKSVGEYFISNNAIVSMGYLGTNPFAIGRYFKEMGVHYVQLEENDFDMLFDTETFKVGDVAIVSMFLDGEKLSSITNIKLANDVDVFKIHTYAIRRMSDDYVLTYNYYDSDTYPERRRLDQLLKEGEKFIIGYVFSNK